MTGFFSSLKRGAKAFSSGFSQSAGRYAAAGKEIVCPHCGGAEFAEGSAQLNTRWMTFLDLDWADKSATTLACVNCGGVLWFLKRPERL